MIAAFIHARLHGCAGRTEPYRQSKLYAYFFNGIWW